MVAIRKTVPLAPRHTLAGQDWTAPRHASTWARLHAGEPRLQTVPCDGMDWKAKAAICAVALIFWTAFFAWIFA